MEENKGILNKIKELLRKILKKENIKMLPSSTTNNQDLNNKTNKLDKYKVDISTNEEKKKEEIEEDYDYTPILEEMNKYTIPSDLSGYSFRTDLSINHYPDYSCNAYICYLSKEGDENLENSLLICMTHNKEKAGIIENALMQLKQRNNKRIIEDLKRLTFKINDDEEFAPTEDYHLSTLLNKLELAYQNNINTITIPQQYLYKKSFKRI